MIDITAQFERINAILQDIPGGTTKAWQSIISRANTTAKTAALRGITSVYDIKAKDVRDRKNTTINLRTRKEGDAIIGEIKYSGGKIPLYRFGVKPKNPKPRSVRVPVPIGNSWVMAHPGGAVSARMLRSESHTRFNNAFVATMRSGHTGLFERIGRRSSKIREIMAVSTPQMAANAEIIDKVEESTLETIAKRTEAEISRIISGHIRG